MTGPQHYREAERWLKLAHDHTDTGDARDEEMAGLFAAKAQVHATLAQAAATAYVAARDWHPDVRDAGCLEWAEVTAS